jgi:hypothetical protein
VAKADHTNALSDAAIDAIHALGEIRRMAFLADWIERARMLQLQLTDIATEEDGKAVLSKYRLQPDVCVWDSAESEGLEHLLGRTMGLAHETEGRLERALQALREAKA